MKMCKFLLACFVASATFFATFETGHALTLDKSSNKNSRTLTDLNLTSKNDDDDDSNAKLESAFLFEPKNLRESLQEESSPTSKNIQDPNTLKPITKHIRKRCIHPISKRRFKCPRTKKRSLFNSNRRKINRYTNFKPLIRIERSNQFSDFRNPYLKKPSLSDAKTTLRNLFKPKFSRDADFYKQETDEENISDIRKPSENEDQVTVVVGRNIVKGRGKKKFICRCYEDNCRGKHCEPSQNLPSKPNSSLRPNTARPNGVRPNVPLRPNFIGPDILNSDRNIKDENIYQIGPIYDPVYYIQNIQRQQQKALLGKSLGTNQNNQVLNSENPYLNSPLYFPQNPLTQYSNIGQPVYYFNPQYNTNPLSKEYPYEIVGSPKTEEGNKISINDCIRLYGRDFCVLSSSTQQDSSEDHSDIFEDEEPVLGAEAPEYEVYEGRDYDGEDYDEIIGESWNKSLEPLEPDDDTFGTFYDDDNEEYYPLKSQDYDSDEAVQHKPKESVGKAIEISSNSRYQTMNSTVGSKLLKETQPEEILGSTNLGETITNTSNEVVNQESEEILGSANVDQFSPNVNVELKEKTIEPVSKEIFADIPPVLGKFCTIETKKSLEVTKDKTCLTENRQYTFSNEEKTSAEDPLIGANHQEVATSSEEKEIEGKDEVLCAPNVGTMERPTVENSELDSNIIFGQRKGIHSYEDLSVKEQQILQSTIISVLNNFDPTTKLTEEEIVGSTKESTLPPILGTPIIRDMFALPQVENMIANSVRSMLSIIPGGNLLGGIADEIIRGGLRNLINNVPVQDDFPIRDDNSPIEVEEHKVKDGEWYTERVPLLPVDPQVGSSQPPKRVLEEVENIVSSPEMGRQVARRPILQNIIMQTVRNSLKSDRTVSKQLVSDANIQNAMNLALSRQFAVPSEMNKISASPNKPISGNMYKNLPSITVTERNLKSGKWIIKTTKLGEVSNERFLGAEKPVDSEDESIAMERPDEIINSEMDSVSGVPPGIPKHEKAAAMTVETSSRSRPLMINSSKESSLKVSNPRVNSSESDDHQIDYNSEEMIEKTPIQYYSPADRLLDYKKNHQNKYYSSVEGSGHIASYDSIQEEPIGDTDSDIPESRPRSKLPVITQPKQFQKDEEDELSVGMAEGSGMFEEGDESEKSLHNVGFFEDYEASGNRNDDYNPSLDENVGLPIENGEIEYVSKTTVAENENTDDQYTGVVFTEESEKNKEIDDYNDEIIESKSEVNKDSLVGQSRDKVDHEGNLYKLTNFTPDVRTTERKHDDDEDQVVGSRNFYSVTDRTLDVRTTERTHDDDKDQVVGSRNFYSVTDRTPDVRTTERTHDDDKDQAFGSRNFYSVTDRTPDITTTERTHDDHEDQVVGSRNFYSVTDRTPDVRTTERSHDDEEQVVGSRNKIHQESSRTSEDDYYFDDQEEDAVFENDDRYIKDEKEIIRDGPLIGEARNEDIGSDYKGSKNGDSIEELSEEVYYIPKSSELQDEDTHLGAANSNHRDDPTYLGKLLPQYRNDPKDSENSDLMYIGDGVRLPLKVIKLNDGSFSLALSDRICDHLMKMNCPCYVRRNQPGVNNRANDEESSMRDDDQGSDHKDYSFRRSSKKAERGRTKTSVHDSGRKKKVSSKQSRGDRRAKKRNDQQYKSYIQTLLDVNDIPEKDRAGFVVNALDRVVNADNFSMKGKIEGGKDIITQKDSIIGKVQKEKDNENIGHPRNRRYETSRRIEVLKAILTWIKDLVFTATDRNLQR